MSQLRVAQDRRDCYWFYVVIHCNTTSQLREPIKDPARLQWNEVSKGQHYWLELSAMTRPARVPEKQPPLGSNDTC